jgi:hypothetical protein
VLNTQHPEITTGVKASESNFIMPSSEARPCNIGMNPNAGLKEIILDLCFGFQPGEFQQVDPSMHLYSSALQKFQQSGGSSTVKPHTYIRRSNRKPKLTNLMISLQPCPAMAGCLLSDQAKSRNGCYRVRNRKLPGL